MQDKKITIAEYQMLLKDYRSFLKKHSISYHVVKRNNHRVKSTIYCNCCHKLLVGFNSKKNSYTVRNSYYKLFMPKKEIAYMCYNSKVCKHNLLKQQDTDMLTLYKVV